MDQVVCYYFFLPEYRPGPFPGLVENNPPFPEDDLEDLVLALEAAHFAASDIFEPALRLPDPNPENHPIAVTSTVFAATMQHNKYNTTNVTCQPKIDIIHTQYNYCSV